ncbi:oligosaccharide flippase family protein [Halioxenophilus aromaticivorans]|uniref:Polysaccharide biosynthesis protein n=1 Tax=Halioxenophilus aromaticivorans TaxID=1306992 RepID=A0AAV3U0Y1_9ALTE
MPNVLVNFLWTFFSLAGSQGVRLVSNLFLTRLLAPELFGLMAVVNSIAMGVQLFSDIGIRNSVIHGSASKIERFDDVAWTVQILRGGLIYLVLAAVAHPFEQFYGNAQLSEVLLILASTALLHGVVPTKVYHLERNVQMKKVAAIDFTAQVLGSVVMVLVAYVTRDIWALVVGSIVIVAARIAAYYAFIPGPNNRMHWDKSAAVEIFSRGRWIFLSSMGLFLVSQGDKLVMGKLLPLEFVGIYAVGVTFSMLIGELANSLSAKFLFPLYHKLKDSDNSLLRVRKMRMLGYAVAALAAAPLMFLGDWIIKVLYDERYIAAGWILQLTALGSLFQTLDASLRPLLLANSDYFRMMIYQFAKGIIYLTLLIGGFYAYGLAGLIAVIVFSPLINLIILHGLVRKYGYRWASLDLVVCLLSIVVVGAVWYWGWSDPVSQLTQFELAEVSVEPSNP